MNSGLEKRITKWSMSFIKQFTDMPQDFFEKFNEFLSLGTLPTNLDRKNHLAHQLFNLLRERMIIELGNEEK